MAVVIALSADEIIVTGRRGALASARAQERASDQIKSIVTADDLGNFGDNNVAESLQRIPGLTINRSEGEGRQPAVRGLANGSVTVTVDGARLGSRASAGGQNESRSVDLDVISSDLLGGIEVTKTLTPDLDADAIGGNVNLKTLSAFDIGEDTIRLRAEGSYIDKAETYNPKLSGSFSKIFDAGAAGQLGVTGGVSWQRRRGFVDDLRIDDGLQATPFSDGRPEADQFIDEVDDPNEGNNLGESSDDDINAPFDILVPGRIDLRADPNERRRTSANLGLEWRPNDGLRLFARGTYARYEDDDVRQRIRIEIDDASDEEIITLAPNSGTFADVDFSKRYRFTEQVDDIYSITAGGEFIKDAWTISTQFDYSSNESNAPSLEARFRERDIFASYENLGIDGVDFTFGPNPADNSDPTDPDNFDFRFVTQYDFLSEDEILSIKADIQRDFLLGGREASIKIGGKYTDRDRMTDIDRATINSADSFTLDNFTLLENGPPQTDFNFGFTPDLDELNAFVNDVAATGTIAQDSLISQARDNVLSEEVIAGYFRADFSITDTLSVIAGVRVEHTNYVGQGFIVEQISYDDDVCNTIGLGLFNALQNSTATFTAAEATAFLGDRLTGGDILTGLCADEVGGTPEPRTGENSYTDVFGNFNVRWEPTDEILVRLAFTQAIQRPEFGEISPNGILAFNDQVDGGDVGDFVTANFPSGEITTIADAQAAFDAGVDLDSNGVPIIFENTAGDGAEPFRDPTLNPWKANQVDATISWYPNDDTFFQVGVFYKDISDFIVRVIFDEDNIGLLGLPGNPTNTIDGGFDQGETFINGDAEVYGLEIAYAQNYTFLPKPFDGLFFSGNATFTQSEGANPLIDRDLSLPEQADFVGNMSVGYENETFSIRWSGNYVGERFRNLNRARLGLTDYPESDEFERSRFSMDINTRYNVSDNIQAYFDVLNVNDAEDRRFFLGGGLTGPVYSQIENYGRTFQLGVRAKF